MKTSTPSARAFYLLTARINGMRPGEAHDINLDILLSTKLTASDRLRAIRRLEDRVRAVKQAAIFGIAA